ncbi:MAG TPA: VTT domain-containing protein, partial [Usitatibacter sp.]|nr:VTT domain-containing protein [Usitatibacter sp.]
MNRSRLFVLILLVAAVVAFFATGAHRYFTFEHIKAEQARLAARFDAHPAATAAAFFALYVGVAALALPGAALLTLAAGAIFGLLWGTVLVSFASSIGATLAFLLSRFVLRDWIKRRYASRVEAVDRGIEKEGAFYLFTLRLIPAIPFFVVNV